MTKEKEVVDVTQVEIEMEELKSRVNRYLERLDNDYQFYKHIYVEHINDNKNTTKQQLNYENAKKQLENALYYFRKYKYESTDNTDTVIKDEDLLPKYLVEE